MQSIKRTTFFISMPLGFISLIFPIYAMSFGANGLEIGLLYSIFSIISIIMRPMVGRLIDNKGRRVGILIGVFLYLLANINFLIASDLNWLLLARIIQSFGASFLWISIDTYIADISDIKNRSTNYGINGQTTNKGGFIGSFIGFYILLNNFSDNPFKAVFMIFSLTSFLALYFGFKDIEETNYISISNDNTKLKRFKYYKQFLVIILIKSFIVNLTTPIFLLYLQDNITNDVFRLIFLFVPATVLSMFLPRKFGQIADSSSREKIIFMGTYLVGILQIFFPFIKSYNGFMILYIIISVVDMFYSPAYSSLIIDFVGEDKRGNSYGLYSLASGLGAAIGPLIGAFIYENIGNHLVFYIKGMLLIALTSYVCYLYYKRINHTNKRQKLLE